MQARETRQEGGQAREAWHWAMGRHERPGRGSEAGTQLRWAAQPHLEVWRDGEVHLEDGARDGLHVRAQLKPGELVHQAAGGAKGKEGWCRRSVATHTHTHTLMRRGPRLIQRLAWPRRVQ